MSEAELNSEETCEATPHLRDQIIDARIPKNEREWWAAREIERLESELNKAQAALRFIARTLERELNKAQAALRFIAEWGGRTFESEYGDIDCNGKWCAEQAKEAAK